MPSYETMKDWTEKKKEFYPIYEPKKDPVKNPMKVAVLFSGGASAVPYMVDGKTYEVVGAISSSKDASGIKKLEKMGIPVEVNDIHDFYREHSGNGMRDMRIRAEYDERTLAKMTCKLWLPDIIACSGYMYLLTDVFLDHYYNRILNVHPADLSIKRNGKRKYTGDNAVRDAIEAGETSTRSTIHIMNDVVDGGPVLLMSDCLPVEGRNYRQQQELMKEACDGPAYKKTLEMLSTGKFSMDLKNNVFVKSYGSENDEYVGLG